MVLYAESSALLAWLFGEARGPAVVAILAGANIVTSDLSLVECSRAVQRGLALGRIDAAEARDAEADIDSMTSSWNVLRLAHDVVARARQGFPFEPIHSLDALHVACAIQARAAHSGLAFLTLDERIRRVAAALGFAVLPN